MCERGGCTFTWAFTSLLCERGGCTFTWAFTSLCVREEAAHSPEHSPPCVWERRLHIHLSIHLPVCERGGCTFTWALKILLWMFNPLHNSANVWFVFCSHLSLWNGVQNEELFSLIRIIHVWIKYIIIFLLSRFARPKSNNIKYVIIIRCWQWGRFRAKLSNHRAERKYAVLWLVGCPYIVYQAGSELTTCSVMFRRH